MTWPETFERAAAHFSALAMLPGWWQYAQQRVAELETDELWTGLRAEVGRRIKESGFRPRKSDLVACEREVRPLQPLRRWPGG